MVDFKVKRTLKTILILILYSIFLWAVCNTFQLEVSNQVYSKQPLDTLVTYFHREYKVVHNDYSYVWKLPLMAARKELWVLEGKLVAYGWEECCWELPMAAEQQDCVYVYMCICMCMHVCMYVCTCVDVYLCMCM